MKNYTKVIIIHSVSCVNFTIHSQIKTNKKNISVFIIEFTLSKKKNKITRDDKCHTGKREEKLSKLFLTAISKLHRKQPNY